MRILFAINYDRGVPCVEATLAAGHHVVGLIASPLAKEGDAPDRLAAFAERLKVPLLRPSNVNDSAHIDSLKALRPDVVVMAGYGQIVKQPFIELAPRGCVNLHGGHLPTMRGSSPLNWALLRGEKTFSISIIQVDLGVDTGPVLAEKQFPISMQDSIVELHAKANQTFPILLTQVLSDLDAGTLRPRLQDEGQSGYFPLRFPDDGFVLWDQQTAEHIHNQIRALRPPYPGAFSFLGGKRVVFVRSRLTERPFYGEPGRIYQKKGNALLVAASDRGLWIEEAYTLPEKQSLVDHAHVYDQFLTMKNFILTSMKGTVAQ